MDKLDIGKEIRRARERKRWRQEDLAEKLGVDRKTVDNWENGRTSPRSSAGAIEELLDIRLDGESRASDSVGSSGKDAVVYRKRDETTLKDAVRELGRSAEVVARGIEGIRQAAAVIADELDAEPE